MAINRGEVLDKLCSKIGITQRAGPGSTWLSKRELLQLNSWIDITQGRINKLKAERKATDDGTRTCREP